MTWNKGGAAQDTYIPVGARLHWFHHIWEDSYTNQFLKHVLQKGHTLPFLQSPPPFSGIIQTLTTGTLGIALKQELEQLLHKKAIEELKPSE